VRPIQILVWYPAVVGGGATTMRVRDYGALSSDPANGPRSIKVASFVAGMEPALDDSLWAVKDASIESGRFPVVIYAPGASGEAWENADLCELIASQGYVVLASPSQGVATWTMTLDMPGVATQAADISFLISYARTLPNAAESSVAVLGDSWGGLANVFAAARDSRVGALVSLDGSIRYAPGLVARSGDVHPEQMKIPLLSFEQGDNSREYVERYADPVNLDGTSVLNAWTHGDLVRVHMLGMPHAAFTSQWQRSEDYWRTYPELLPPDARREDAVVGYGWVARYVVKFLDAYVKNDAAARAFLHRAPVQNGASREVMTATSRAAK